MPDRTDPAAGYERRSRAVARLGAVAVFVVAWWTAVVASTPLALRARTAWSSLGLSPRRRRDARLAHAAHLSCAHLMTSPEPSVRIAWLKRAPGSGRADGSTGPTEGATARGRRSRLDWTVSAENPRYEHDPLISGPEGAWTALWLTPPSSRAWGQGRRRRDGRTRRGRRTRLTAGTAAP
ncbi:hypothetical protein [Catellatospora tritici]|uniref:hypothetical protein n=1 Tax=Catellatospora tritici TaxID=2851566 RepID=UPI001C2D4CD6|nr:hypothetical protein [Catellatospora tritici]MBV1855610.1 hypothetical protein [Catellatospora tritici]